MGAVYFYHLTRNPVEQTLPLLLGKALGAGWRCLVLGGDPSRLEALDHALWMGDEAAFLPHGLAGGAHDADQPVLLSGQLTEVNGASCVMSVHGADISAEAVQRLERTCILFDGLDDAAVSHARVQWKTLTTAGCAAQYWSEESGSWQKKAESG